MRKLVIATGNPGKVKEISQILSDLDFDVRSLSEYPSAPEPEENADSFAGNAAIKALAAAERTGELALADDSGLAIDALDGAPGVYSSRFAGEGATDKDRNAKVLDLLKDVSESERTARFVSAIAIAEPGKLIGAAEGTCEGIIAHEACGTNGFGYDPIFFVAELGQMMAELSDEAKNRVSHRGRALEKAKDILKQIR